LTLKGTGFSPYVNQSTDLLACKPPGLHLLALRV
jgi:hypothetical protein